LSTALLVVGGLFFVVYGPLALLAWRRPMLARLAFRESVRRRGQLALLVGGLMIGTASITASLVGADSAHDSRLAVAYGTWGAVDLTVSAYGRLFPAEVADRLGADPQLAPYVDGVQAGVELVGSVADVDQEEAEDNVSLVGFDPRTQRPFGAFELVGGRATFGEDMQPGDVLLSEALARALRAHVGDRLRISAGSPGDGTDLRVAGIAGSEGPGSYSSAGAIYMPLGTARLIMRDERINVVRISARGAEVGSLDAAILAASPLRSAVSRLGTGTPLLVGEGKRAAVHQFEVNMQALTAELLAFTGLIVAAGLALVVNLMLALAEERRPRLAILRALGLSRQGVIVVSVLEGGVYSLGGAGAGIVVGIFAGRLVGEQTTAPYGFAVVYPIRPSTLAVAFAAGAVITLATVVAAAYRTSRMSIAAAVKDLPEPAPSQDRRPFHRAFTVLALILGIPAVLYPDPLARLFGGVLLIAAGAAFTRGRLPDRGRATITGLLLAAWSVTAATSNMSMTDMTKYMSVFTGGTLLAVFGLCVAAAANLRILEATLGLMGSRFGRLQAALRPPMAQLSRRPVPTGLATGTFALALVLVTMLAMAVSAYRPDYARDSAGYDIRLVSHGHEPIQLPPDIENQIAGRVDIPVRVYTGPIHSPAYGPNGESIPVPIYEFPDQMLENNPPVYVTSRDKAFASPHKMWQAIARDSSLIVVNYTPPGGEVTLQGVHGPLQLRVAGNTSSILDGVIASSRTLAEIETSPAGSTVLLKTKPGVDPESLARQIEHSLVLQGVRATTTHELLDRGYTGSLAWLTFFDVILRMGLLVGVLSLAVVGIRAAVERRRAIGIMRSLGYQAARVMAGLVAEAVVTATIGVLTGVAAGVVIGYLMLPFLIAGDTYGIDGGRMGVALVIIYGTALFITAALAWRAAQMNPADALRHTG
jgi:putative ABC transport system permease protein